MQEQQRQQREQRRERRLQEHTELWFQLLPSFVPGWENGWFIRDGQDESSNALRLRRCPLVKSTLSGSKIICPISWFPLKRGKGLTYPFLSVLDALARFFCRTFCWHPWMFCLSYPNVSQQFPSEDGNIPWFSIQNGYLGGGLEHFLMFPHIGNVIIPTDFHIFQGGRYCIPPTSNS